MRQRLIAVILVAAPFVALACDGEVERAFYDDTSDGSAVDGTAPNDATSGDSANTDGTVGEDGNGDGSVGVEGGKDSGADSRTDSGTDSATDARTDSGRDSASDSGSDSGTDGGCGPTITAQNCGACGNACDTTTSLNVGCTATAPNTCFYASCNAGLQDCNSATPPNLDGCECKGTACCSGGSCQTEHSNGLGQNFYDCVAPSTYNQAQATAACTAWNNAVAADGGTPGVCQLYICQSGNTYSLICSTSNSACACWKFIDSTSGGTLYPAGHVRVEPGTSCYCPNSTNPTWN